MILKQKYFFINIMALGVLLFTLYSCKKTDQFYNKLQTLPQVNVSTTYAYRSAYIVGDTMRIVGRLQPKNDLQITVGGVNAVIVKVDSVSSLTFPGHSEDQVSLLITNEMAGKAKDVKITSGGYSVLGPAIDVYTAGGEGSFNSQLESLQIATLSSAYQLLYCMNGRGDVYYYAPTTKDLHHIKKDGTQEIVYDLSGLGINSFLAGAVDPLGKYLYYSIKTASGYKFCRLDLQTKAQLVLNQSTGLSAPYEGTIGSVNMIVTGIYPDAKGNLYLGIGLGNGDVAPNFVPDAIARYNSADGGISYVYKGMFYGSQQYTGMPGVNIATNIISVRFNPDENLLYVIYIDITSHIGIKVYSLSIGTLIKDLKTNNTTGSASQYNVIAPFSGLQINIGTGNDVNSSFGFLPMPHQRLQVLLFQNYQQATDYGFPKWIAFDFINQRTYAYAPGKFQLGGGKYILRDADQMLNYDEDGNLYMTSNSKSYLLKTQPQ